MTRTGPWRPEGTAHVVILGLMASGKSSVGEALAARLGRPFRDNDDELRRVVGTSASEYARAHGLAELHRVEAEVLRSSLQGDEPAVVTAAASLADRPDLADILGDAYVVWLDVDPMVLAARIPQGRDHRPLQVEAMTQLRAQRQRRAPQFRAAADLILTWRHETPDQQAERIARRLSPAGGG